MSRIPTLAPLCACLLLLVQAAPAFAADTPAVAAVREFLADRAAGRNAESYALLSAGSRKRLSPRAWAVGSSPSPNESRKLPAPLLGLNALFGDPNNTLGYTFTVIGPAPEDPDVVLVRAVLGTGGGGMSTVTLRLLTIPDPAARATRVDLIGSLKPHEPREFPQMSESARRALSQSNLKRLSVYIAEYEQDSDERLPDADKWVDELMPYVKDKALFRDPSSPLGLTYSYAYNRALSHKSLAQFESPATTVLLFESAKAVKNASDTGQSVPRPGRHEGGTDYAFADGHVRWLKDGTNPSYRLSGK